MSQQIALDKFIHFNVGIGVLGLLLIVFFIPVTVVLGIVHLARRPTVKPPNLAR